MFEEFSGSLAFFGILAIPVTILIFAFPIVTIIFCWINNNLSVARKILWTIIIVLSWPFCILGSIMYGLINFSSKAGKIFTIFVTLLMITLWYLFFTFDKKDVEGLAKLGIRTNIEITQKKINALPSDQTQVKSELTQNMQTLQQESIDIDFTKNQTVVSTQLVSYLSVLLSGGMTEEEYQEWRSLFFHRDKLTADYMMKLNNNKINSLQRKTTEQAQ